MLEFLARFLLSLCFFPFNFVLSVSQYLLFPSIVWIYVPDNYFCLWLTEIHAFFLIENLKSYLSSFMILGPKEYCPKVKGNSLCFLLKILGIVLIGFSYFSSSLFRHCHQSTSLSSFFSFRNRLSSSKDKDNRLSLVTKTFFF